MTAPAITEISAEEIAVRNSDRVWRRVSRSINVPDSLAGKYVTAVAVVTSVQLNDAQETALKGAIEAIAGVDMAHIMVGASRLSHDRLPADDAQNDYQLHVVIEMGLDGKRVEIPQ